MNSTNYITPFWIQDLNQTSGTFTINIYRTQGYSSSYKLTIYYSTDGSTWSTFGTTGSGQTISQSFSAGTKVYLRCNSDYWSCFIGNDTIAHQITANKTHAVGGNVMSLIYGSTFAENRKYVTFPDDSIKGVFLRMFFNNTNLIDAGELVLPVTHSTSTLPSQLDNTVCLASCYSRMFYGCTNLVNGPHIDLRARGQYDLHYCFNLMFQGCTSLMSVHCNTQSGNYRFNTMFSNGGGASGSVFYDYSGGPASSEVPTARMEYRHIVSMYLSGVNEYDRVVDWHSDYSGRVYQVTDNNSKVIYKIQGYDSSFYVKNLDNTAHDLFIKINSSYEPTYLRHNYYYSTDNVNWTLIGKSTYASPLTVSVPANTTYYLKSDCTDGRLSSTDQYGATGPDTQIYSTSGKWSIGGNIMSLAYGGLNNWNEQTSFSYPGVLENLFADWTTLVDAKDLILPATILTVAAYQAMFSNCTSLQSAPILVEATTYNVTYGDMFMGCSSLTELWCYSNVNVNSIKRILSIWNPSPGVVHCINPAVWIDPYEHILPSNWTAVQI